MTGSSWLAGCGQPRLPAVTGTVTLGDEPLADALISFLPEDDQLEPVFAWTDSQGRYVLETNGRQGAAPGHYTVRISSYNEGNEDADPPLPRRPERVPVQYNVETTLTADITVEPKQVDFRLEARGRIVQP